MAYLPYQRACLSIPFNEVPHLFVVMNDPTADGDCLLLMVSSDKENRMHDTTCALDDGDHPYVDRPSHIVYRIAETMRAAHIARMVELKYYEPRVDMDVALFERVADGVFASDDTRQRIITFAKTCGL